MRLARMVLLAVLVTPLAGCLTFSTLLTVKPDGSGTIEQTMTMSAAAVAQVSQLAAGFGAMGGASKNGKPLEMFSETDVRAAAAKMGEGVTFVSSEKIKTKDAEGVKALYAFTDITKIKLNQKPDPPVPAPGGMKIGGAAPEDIHFRFARQAGGPSTVTLVFPEVTDDQVKKAQKAGTQQKIDPQALAMAQMVLKDLRISIVMQVAGRIVRTNSPYVEGSRVTLLDLNFNDLLADPALFQKVQGIESLEQAKSVLKGVKGFKFNFEREVVVEFASR